MQQSLRGICTKVVTNRMPCSKELIGGTDGEITIRCSNVNDQEPDRIIHFDPTHLADIRDCLGQEDECVSPLATTGVTHSEGVGNAESDRA